MPFEKGKSGNPGGRPKKVLADGRTLAEIAKEHTPQAVETLRRIATDKKADPRAQVAAAVALLDRGWGRPTQTMELGDKTRGLAADIEAARRRTLENMSDTERAVRIASLLHTAQKRIDAEAGVEDAEYEPLRYLTGPDESAAEGIE